MNTRITFTFLLMVLMASGISAQVIWGGPGDPNGEFDGGLNDWTTVGISSAVADSSKNAVWFWSADAAPNMGAYGGNNTPISSPSATNGAATFDSDFYDTGGTVGAFGQGLAPAPQISELISPVIDCSGNETVLVTFYQEFRNFDAEIFLDVSTDGGVTFDNSYPITEETFTNDEITFAESFYRIDITEIAANMDSVVLKFVFNGDFYYWIIDDVAVIEKPDENIFVGEIYFSADYRSIPVSQVDAVNHEFSMDIINLGREDQYDVMAAVSITDQDLNTLFSDSLVVDTLFADETLTIVFDTIVNSAGMPFGEVGLYNLIYEIFPSDSDISNRDDLSFERFAVTADRYSLDDERFQYYGTGQDIIGNLYRTGNWEGQGNGAFVASKMYISATDGFDAGGRTIDAEVTGTVFRVNDDVAEDFSNFDNSADLSVLGAHPSLTPVGYAIATLEGEDASIFEIDLIDFETDDLGVTLEPNSRYFFMIQNATNRDLFFGFNQYIDYFQISTVAYGLGDRMYLGGFGPDFALGAAIDLAFLSSATETELPQTTLNVFPNPAEKQFNVSLNFDKSTDVTILVTGIDGRIFQMDNLTSVTQANKAYSAANLANGTYVIRILTDNGARTQKLVIQK